MVCTAGERIVIGYLTEAQFAERVCVTVNTLGSWRRRGLPRGNPVPQCDRRSPDTGVMEWLESTVDAWIAARTGRGARTDLATGR